jgi:hypothetical protein
LAAVLSLLRGCFSQPTFETFSMLVVGFTGRVRDCTVTGMLQAAGLAGVWHHSRAHDFFARRCWDPDEVGLLLLEFVVKAFVGRDAPVRFAVDDTLFGRSGRKVWGAHYLHDGAQPEGSRAADALGELLGRGRARDRAPVSRRSDRRPARPVQAV